MSQLNYRPYILPLIQEQQHRGVRSVLSLLGVVNQPLRTHLTARLGAPPGTQGALLADPVFEPTFGWTESDLNLGSLKGTLLNTRLVNALSNPPAKLADEYSFPLTRRPFTHQLQSWKILAQPEPKSLVVTSGTGSGKTECFMVPILNRLANQSDNEGSLIGVRALFIYPLNALIASQQNRLDAWTDGFNGELRYCLYTGQLEQKQKSSTKEYAGQVIDRDGLRKSPPPMLITNATMLEYMLVRKEDAPILGQSQGKLEWIVLDEAHTYVGSQAAEMALLLRRTMIAFGVKPSNVRFIATSATFGQDAETTKKLQRFLADMAGVDTSQVEVVFGQRKVPALPDATTIDKLSVSGLEKIEPELKQSALRYKALATNKTALHIRSSFLNTTGGCQPKTLSQLIDGRPCPDIDTNSALQWLDLLSGTNNPDGTEFGTPFLPLRIHLFHNVLSSVGACVNSLCSERTGDLLDKNDWNFGAIYTDSSTKCKCGSPVLPLVQCTDCAAPYLKGFISSTTFELLAAIDEDEDEFALNIDVSEDINEDEQTQRDIRNEIYLCNLKYSDEVRSVWFDLETKKLSDKANSELSAQVNFFEQMDDVSCPCCLGRNNKQFRRIAVGAPFTLSTVISALLEFCPEDKHNSNDKPFSGKKMISFTDSRQGTARTAIKIQQDSERGKIRSFVYHSLVSINGKSTLSTIDFSDLAELEEERKKGQLSPRDQRNYDRLAAQIKASASKSISWDDMLQKLSMDGSVQHAMLDYYKRISPRVFQDGLGPRTLSKLFLFREFARRPKHQNSLESMGLVRLIYPQLDKITKAPVDWPHNDLPSWKNYLKILLDFFIRENSYVAIPPEYLPLMGARIRPKWLMPPTSKENNSSKYKRWPQAEEGKSRFSRPISLLLAAFNWAPDAPKLQAVNRILCDAWNVLHEYGILKRNDDGSNLSFDDLHFQLIEKAGLCPFTRRFLDTDFGQLTPYLSTDASKAKVLEVYSIPVYTNAFNNNDVDLQAARTWLENNAEVVALRNNGLWSDLHDRIVEGVNFFRTAEHSAQQSQKRLKEYEDLFKQGRVNLLSCSTTMEMGVDIGGITIVAMNNVPPHPANYLQRAGRAGRRSETRSVAMTVCKQTPHDQSVFKDPMWPFKTKIAVPEVSLRSQDLLQRHINAYLLSSWLKIHVRDAEALKLSCGAFFIPSGDQSFADRFSIWATSIAKDINHYPTIKDGLSSLIKNTVFNEDNLSALANETQIGILAAQSEWRKSLDAILNQIENIFSGSKESNPAFKALSIQRHRLEDEYLLGELAECHFLPGYGFPTGIVAFDNLSVANYKHSSDSSREDNRGRFRQLPSRDRATGIREYAPGAEIVIDGLVYKSSGITLNWHAPASEKDLKEAQLFKFAWHCKECGAAGSSIGGRPDFCECCGKELQRDRIKEYLVPSGFAVEFYGEDPHTDVSAPTYVPVQQPWLSLNTNWMPLVNPANGQFRSSNSAHLFHYTSGTAQNGFAICLECGRAEQMLAIPDAQANTNEEYLPKIFRKNHTHTRLRGGKNEKGENLCPGSDNAWKIKQNVHLGHDSKTDAIEIIVQDPITGIALHNDVISYSLAVAIRSCLAHKIGVKEDEFGCASREQKVSGKIVSVIQIFDTKSGGYCSQANELLLQSDFWQSVRTELMCKEDCAAACQHCLLSYDTRFSFNRLNRHDALGFLSVDWLNVYSLPENLRGFGESTSYEVLEITDSLRFVLAKPSTNKVRLFLHGAPETWDFPSSQKLNSIILACISRNIKVELIGAIGLASNLQENEKFKLASYMSIGALYGETNLDKIVLKDFDLHLVAQIQSHEQWKTWATTNPEFVIPNQSWGNLNSTTIYVKGDKKEITEINYFKKSDIRPKTGDTEIEIINQIDSPIIGFGKRFWEELEKYSEPLTQNLNQDKDPLVSVEYSDRYLRNPLAIALLIDTVNELKNYPCGDVLNISVQISTISSAKLDTRQSINCWDDWKDEAVRDQILEGALSYCGLDPKVSVVAGGAYSQVGHGRVMTLRFTSGKTIKVRLDQGFSYWRISTRPSLPFPFSAAISEQVERIASLPGAVTSSGSAPTQIFVKCV
ncbi:DEAD/DEAH box helicase [Undibacterium sp.]|uniref:DEAD/DEAH box helicase n=1 Tax=Undibacterium sp. TaxID=1914977 RepID=UPI0025EBD5A4|nr:DEAD/DEAH box helicase [Undibacterium sp.]